MLCHAWDFRSFVMTKAPFRRPFAPVSGKSSDRVSEFYLSSPAGLVEMPGTGKLSRFLVKNI
jgi:hypothetical protein